MLVLPKKTSVLEEEELLRMVDIEFIRKKHFVEGWSIRKIARNLGISRQSVRKALAVAGQDRIPTNGQTVSSLSDKIVPTLEQ